jgi:hypothetical protein
VQKKPKKLLRNGPSTKTVSSNPVRRSGRPSLCQSTPRGGADNRPSAEQPREAERTIKSLPSNPTRRDKRPGPCQANRRKGKTNAMLLTRVSMTRCATTKPLRTTNTVSRSLCRTQRYVVTYSLRRSPTDVYTPVNPGRRDLSVGVSTVTHVQERTGRYTMLGVCLRMLEGDARVMTEDEVVLNTTLNPS